MQRVRKWCFFIPARALALLLRSLIHEHETESIAKLWINMAIVSACHRHLLQQQGVLFRAEFSPPPHPPLSTLAARHDTASHDPMQGAMTVAGVATRGA